MSVAGDLHAKLLAVEDRADALALLKRAVGRESITGNEANFVSLLDDELTARDLKPQQDEFLPGRPNIWSERKGSGGGPRLQFIGHTDTVHVDGWRSHWAGTSREDPFAGAEIDGAVWARGVSDLKGGICASILALDWLDRAGIRLKGDVALAFIGDEESGEEGTGISAGIAHWSDKVLAGDIARPDFAVYVEPTSLSVFVAQIGFFIADVVVTGKSAYFGKPELGIDAVKATHKVLSSVWEYTAKLEAMPSHDLTGQASVLVTSLSGGGSIAVPGECKFSVIGSLRPGDDVGSFAAGFDLAVRGTELPDGITVDINYLAGRDHEVGGSPVEIQSDCHAVQTLQSAIKTAMPESGEIGGAPYWSESPFLVKKLGCPTVYCAPGDIGNCHTVNEHLNIDEYLAAIRAYAIFMAQFCGVSSQ